MTSDNQSHVLKGFIYLWQKYASELPNILVCGFTPSERPGEFDFYSIGKFADYPVSKWSDALIKILDTVAEEVFLLLLDDYWLIRPADTKALNMMYYYMFQFQNVVKFDVTTERLFAEGGSKYAFGYHTYNHLGYLDLIKSSPGSMYHLSLWGGFWRRDLLRQVLIPGETAQQIEINGTGRLGQFGDEWLVLGTRQAPMLHANIIQRGEWNQDAMTGIPALSEADRKELKGLGYIP